MRRRLMFALGMGLAVVLVAGLNAQQDSAAASPAEKVGLCHVTGSDSNPLVFIEVSANALPAHLAHGDFRAASAAECAAAAAATRTAVPTNTPTALGFTGVLQATVIGGKLDLNGDGAVDGGDDSNSLLGSMSVIDGMVDCNGNLAITVADNCILVHRTLGVIVVTGGVLVG